ncbi:hypothetical protein E5288_WYG005167 [Bos mutus]|uniref:Uncharacterized protein n=1 Tax=Bos mutus TaxID=72004 RepID=A0A6B0S1E9_9CETA|nr:hypothetical protein [Bos mutus]
MCRDPHPLLFGPVLLGAGGISAHVVFRTPASYGLTVLSLSLTLGPFSPGRGTDPKKAEEGHDPSWHRAGILQRVRKSLLRACISTEDQGRFLTGSDQCCHPATPEGSGVWLTLLYQLLGVRLCSADGGHDVLTEILGQQGQGDLTAPSAVCLDGSFHFLSCDGSPTPLPQAREL